MSDKDSRRKNAIKGLKDSPLYILSTAGMELFHSNMLYWIASTYPEESMPIWRSLGMQVDPKTEVSTQAFREKSKIDLWVRFKEGGGEKDLILENKISAIPTKKQLDGYESSLNKRPDLSKDRTMVLLGLMKPHFAGEMEPWAFKNYREMLGAIRETATSIKGNQAMYVNDYANLVEALIEFCDAFKPDDDDPAYLDSFRSELDSGTPANPAAKGVGKRPRRFCERPPEDIRRRTEFYSRARSGKKWFGRKRLVYEKGSLAEVAIRGRHYETRANNPAGKGRLWDHRIS